MNAFALALRQIRYENTAFWRNPAAAFFTIVFPLMFLVIFNVVFGDGGTDEKGEPANTANFFVPGIVVFAVVGACYSNVAMGICFSRDGGLLKRVRGTPLPGWSYLFGRIAHSVLIATLLVVMVTGAGVLFYDVDVPTNTLAAFLLALMAGAATFCALGLAITAIIPNANAAPAIVNASILPLLFISDVFIPMDGAPQWLTTLANIFPIRHFALALHTSFLAETGTGFEWGHLLVMAGWLGGWATRWRPLLPVGTTPLGNLSDIPTGLTSTVPTQELALQSLLGPPSQTPYIGTSHRKVRSTVHSGPLNWIRTMIQI